jgi:uncharacterized protein
MTDPIDTAVPPPPPDSSIPPLGPSQEDRQWGMFAHLSALAGLLVGGWGIFIGPLIIWLVKKDQSSFIGDQAKEALNFNITVGIAGLALVLLTAITFGIGIILTLPVGGALFVAWLVFTIIAGVKANEGVLYRYPFTLRLIS